jgi:Flp pilus assembly pilin Flp
MASAMQREGASDGRWITREGVKRGMLRMYVGLQTWVATHRDREEGQALVEYALILALIAVVSILALTDLGVAVRTQLEAIGTAISGA